MALNRADGLGLALLLWAGAGLLSLYLLCNPAATLWLDRLGPQRLWGTVLGLVALGLALADGHAWGWALLAASLLLVFLPPSLARWAGPAALIGGTVWAGAALAHQRTRQCTGAEAPAAREPFRRPARRAWGQRGPARRRRRWRRNAARERR